MTVAGLLLAAGGGRRFGSPKALVEFDGQLLVERGIALLAGGGCSPVHVVLGAAYDEVVGEADLAGTAVVRNNAWESGMGSSVRAGLASLAALPDEVDAVVIALVDQPLVSTEAVARLCAAHADGAMAAVATYAGQPRNPVLLARSTWADVAELAVGDAGARRYLRSHPDVVRHVPCDDVASAVDIDDPSDLATLRAHAAKNGDSGDQESPVTRQP
jgi:nicotine blue oxidoreductase